jgi:Peptidase inhibitor family I36
VASFAGTGSYSASQIVSAGGRDNDASSLKIASGYKVTLYSGDNFSGSSLVLTGNDSCFVADNFNDSASSMKIEAAGGSSGVVFYQDSNFGGAAGQPLAKGSYTLSQLQAKGVANDWASSVKIPSGWTVTLYQHDNFGGTAWTLTSDSASLGALSPSANDQLSSCKVQ